MNRLVKLRGVQTAFLVIVLFGGWACSDFGNALTVEVETVYELQSEFLFEDSTASTIDFHESDSVDPQNIAVLQPYFGKIIDVILDEIVVFVSDMDSSLLISNSSFSIYTDSLSVKWDFGEIDFFEDYELTLGNENDEWDKLTALISTMDTFHASFSGTANHNSIDFILSSQISLRIIAKAK
ncbi:MAG: hypothetical protein HN352_14850 [Bacteroidetes bacterium]|jgi:hypothetical protein|nr:hypothetical protein [Bacteroidota bacterium]MBT4402054.1 hypothetical protein [Bacteroidota bacterium]MBT4409433.1 hypothetical protein [Bacteroidota bacterium]MBT5425569.1 hypothetical protein [Bacteroidota bacterium]MBT7093542.1 hypothetical protein [Bacteroidota bacterium]